MLLVADGPLHRVTAAIEKGRNRLRRNSPHTDHLPQRVERERDRILAALGDDWPKAVLATVGRWAFDYAILLASLAAVGAYPSPGLVLLAFCAAQVLAQIPVTPGGLGFVETGLTALLALAGVGAGDAVLATFLYRLFTYWLPLPLGLVGLALHRRHTNGDAGWNWAEKGRRRGRRQSCPEPPPRALMEVPVVDAEAVDDQDVRGHDHERPDREDRDEEELEDQVEAAEDDSEALAVGVAAEDQDRRQDLQGADREQGDAPEGQVAEEEVLLPELRVPGQCDGTVDGVERPEQAEQDTDEGDPALAVVARGLPRSDSLILLSLESRFRDGRRQSMCGPGPDRATR